MQENRTGNRTENQQNIRRTSLDKTIHISYGLVEQCKRITQLGEEWEGNVT